MSDLSRRRKRKISAHDQLHDLTPAYAALSRIKRLAVEGWNNGGPMYLTNNLLEQLFRDIQNEADEGMGVLKEIENELRKEL